MSLSAETLREKLDYDRATGDFTWKIAPNNSVPVGSRAGQIRCNGYVRIGIGGRQYLAHRLAWFYVTGEWPVGQIDHRDTCRSNNRWVNLRQATHSENCRNRRAVPATKSGLKGATWNPWAAKWQASIRVGGRIKRLGYFACPGAAHLAYVAAAVEHYGEFTRAR